MQRSQLLAQSSQNPFSYRAFVGFAPAPISPRRTFPVIHRLIAAAVLFCLAGSGPPALAQADAGTLVVHAVAPDGAALSGASISVMRAGETVAEGQTDADGTLTIEQVAPGTYLLRVSATSFVEVVKELRVDAGGKHAVTARMQLAPLEERVTVAATRTERTEFEVPGEVSVLERRDLDLVQARSLDDVLRYVPGVEMTDTARRLGQAVSIRGFDEKRVLTLKDGARIAQFNSAHKGTAFLEVEDIDSIEIVKGASSALYGSGAIGGVVSVTTRDPGDLLDPGNDVGFGLRSSYSTAYSEIMFTPRLYGRTRSGLGWLLSYTGRNNDGTIRLAGEPSELTRAEEDMNGYAVRITTPIGTTSSLRLSFDRFAQSGASLTNLSVIEPGPSTSVDRDTRQTVFNAQFSRTGDSWLDRGLSVTVYYTDLGIDETRLSDGRIDDIDYRTWGVNARNTTQSGSHNTLTYGFEYVDERQRALRNDEPSGFFPDGTRRHVAGFVQDEIRLVNGRLSIVPGLRFDHLSSRAADAEIKRQSFDRLSPKIGATYRLAPNVFLAASHGHGFRAPLFQEAFPAGVHFAFPSGPFFFLALFEPNPDLVPERSRNWDAGFRFRVGSARGRVAYWESRVRDFIDLLPVATLPPSRDVILQTWQSLNRQDAFLHGAEATLDWQPHVHWVLRGAYSIARGVDRATDEVLLQLPQDRLVVGLDWSQPDAGTHVSWATRVYASRDSVPTGIEPTGGYVLHDVHVRWTPRFLSKISLFASVNNITDKRYEDPRFGTPGVGRDLRFGFGLGF